MKIKLQKQNGFSLIELMIAILIGLIVLAATITIYITAIKGSSDTMKSAQLNQDLGVAVTIITNDLRRAGFWSGAVVGANSINNPFMVSGSTNLAVYDADSCIVYSYDADRDGSIMHYGFKLNAGTIEMKTSGATTANCDDGVWVDMLDSAQVNIRVLTFQLTESQCFNKTTKLASTGLCVLSAGETGVEIRNIVINLEGEAKADASIKTKLQTTVTVRNNRIIALP